MPRIFPASVCVKPRSLINAIDLQLQACLISSLSALGSPRSANTFLLPSVTVVLLEIFLRISFRASPFLKSLSAIASRR